MDYSKTVNLLQTAFPMKADLPVREPLMLQHWESMGLYRRIQTECEGRPAFLLHDGPPYANGEIHIGHALNKILKDIVVKQKTLAGFHAPYKPGWDCHGLPIEHQLFKQLGKGKHQVSRTEVRTKAAEYARSFVEKQKADFIRLGVFGEWDNPYLTLTNAYESATVETFFDLKDKGFVYKGLKPGYWCAFDETALAEAEVEYAEKTSDSVYVRFKLMDVKPAGGETVDAVDPAVLKLISSKNIYVLIWTTTPWTLPANRGLAFHPDELYTLLRKDDAYYIVADKLKEAVAKRIGGSVAEGMAKLPGSKFVHLLATNPIHGGVSRAVTADYVTMEDGTGIVHIAPGHGVEDFGVGREWKLEVASPVDERGLYDKNVGREDLVGKHVLKDANKAVMEILGENLVHHFTFKHSYPHCWRCKNPIIFRATSQWFLEVSDPFRQKLLAEIERGVRWEPAYGVHRIKSMVETRPDWCLSRQRHWGAPIAVFHCRACSELLWDASLNAALVKLIAEEGASAYYEKPEAELVGLGGKQRKCAKCGGANFRREMDILDVWFDSGVSWRAVIEKDFADLKPQTVMYLEGSDQHRGWFQTSLIPSVALRGKAPYDIVLTHGFVVDGKGHKMSKSVGNVVSPQDIIKQYGADVLRLWVAMSDYSEDIRVSQDIVKHMVDIYRRFRNVLRFLLQNTADFRWDEHAVPVKDMPEMDRWLVNAFEDLRARMVDKSYADYQFQIVGADINRFMSNELSGFYLDAVKDILYCGELNSKERRSVQTALAMVARGLTMLLAPIVSFTAEEAYGELKKTSWPDLLDSVFLDEFKAAKFCDFDAALHAKWTEIIVVRSRVNEELDKKRKEGVLKSSQEASTVIGEGILGEKGKPLAGPSVDWLFVLQMADVKFTSGDAIVIEKTVSVKCERCWRHRPDVGAHPDHPTLCARCRGVVATLPAGV